MKKNHFFSQIGQRLKIKTSPAPVFLFLLYFILAKMSKNDHHGLMDIFGWLAVFCLFSSLALFAVQLLLGLYHVLTGKGGSQNTMIDRNLPDAPHKKTSLLPLVLIASGLFISLILMFNMDDFSNDVPFVWISLIFVFLILLSIGSIMLLWNFTFGVYSVIRGIIKRRSEKDD